MQRHAQAFQGVEFQHRSRFYLGRYGRLFRNLPPLEAPLTSSGENDNLRREIASDGPPVAPAVLAWRKQNHGIPAGYTYLGQFLAHDVTFNPVSDLTRARDPESLFNLRTPALDLDSVYGRGPIDSPFLYSQPNASNRRGKLAVGNGQSMSEEDLPRYGEEPGIAIIGDPRNDENTIVSQIHLAFIKLHNRLFDEVVNKDPKKDWKDVFAEAQRLTCWHYQWIILHDYLRRICHHDTLRKIWPVVMEKVPSQRGSKVHDKPNLEWFDWKHWPFIPIEFAGAAFRFGHSMVDDEYDINYKEPKVPVFDRQGRNLLGFRQLQLRWTIQWDLFLEFPNGANVAIYPQRSLIGRPFAKSLSGLPPEVLSVDIKDMDASDKRAINLVDRNVRRCFQLGLPSGQAVARKMGYPPLSTLSYGEDPLWLYVLREAEDEGGKNLGKVGSTIVAETIIGLIKGDPLAYPNVEPAWNPTLGNPNNPFEFPDLVRAAGMPITKADLASKPAFEPTAGERRFTDIFTGRDGAGIV